MEAVVVVAEAPQDPLAVVGPQRKNRIQVSTNKKPLFFYVNLAKRYMQHHNEVELSALGMAIGTVVTIAEILKNNGLATEKKILTSTVSDEAKGVRKAKIEILLGKTDNFNDLMTAAKAGRNKPVEGLKEESKEKLKEAIKEESKEAMKEESKEKTKEESKEETKE